MKNVIPNAVRDLFLIRTRSRSLTAFGITTCVVVGSLLAAGSAQAQNVPALATAQSAYCACLRQTVSDSKTRYDGGLDASFRVPAQSLPAMMRDGLELGYAYVWKLGRFEIRYGINEEDMRVGEAAVHRPFDHPRSNVCVIPTDHGRAAIEAIVRDGRRGIWANFEEWPQPYHRAWLEILGDRDSICSWGAVTIKSFAPAANAWQNLTVIAVAPDQESFRYRNEVGMVRRASLGTAIAKDYWKVSSISKSRVTVTVLEEDGTGGFIEVDHPLKFETSSDKDAR